MRWRKGRGGEAVVREETGEGDDEVEKREDIEEREERQGLGKKHGKGMIRWRKDNV